MAQVDKMPRDQKIALISGCAGFALACSTLWATGLELAVFWSNNQSYQFAWLVIPMLAYVLWERHQEGKGIEAKPDFTGLPLAIAAAFCWNAAALMNIDVGRQFALVLAFQAIALSTLGWRAYWKLFPIFGLLFLIVPNGDLLQPVLRTLTVQALELFAKTAGLPHTVDGYALSIGQNSYFVAPECAGLAYFNVAVFLGYSFGLLLYRSANRIVAMLLFGAILGVLINVLRVCGIVLIDWMRGSQMALTDHGQVQWIALIVIFSLMLSMLHLLKADETESGTNRTTSSDQPGISTLSAPMATGMAILLLTASVAWQADIGRGRSRMLENSALPQNLMGWERASPASTWATHPKSNIESIRQVYMRDGRELEVQIVGILSPDTKLPDPQLVPDDGEGWREGILRPVVYCAGADCVKITYHASTRQNSADVRHLYFIYSIDDFVTTSKFALRAAQGWHRLMGRESMSRYIAFSVTGSPLSTEETTRTFRLLQSTIDNPDRRS